MASSKDSLFPPHLAAAVLLPTLGLMAVAWYVLDDFASVVLAMVAFAGFWVGMTSIIKRRARRTR